MKKVIDGKLYNTETAKLIAKADNGCACNDGHFVEEALYKTKKGQFFIHAEGGGLSDYAKKTGSVYSYGERIFLADKEDVLEWFENWSIDSDIIQQHFEIEEG